MGTLEARTESAGKHEVKAMAKKANNGALTKVKEPFGGSTVEERKIAMRRGLTDAEIAERNIIPKTAPSGEPHRIIAEELYSENDTFTPYHPEEPNAAGPAASEPLKPTVLAEGQKITDRIGVKVAPTDPEYWGLASVMTEEEAQLTSHMKVREPLTFAQLQQRCGLDEAALQKLLDDLAVKGIIEYNWENLDGKNPDHEKRYVLPMFVPGSAEFTVMNQQQMEEHPEISTFFERMSYLPLTKVTKMVPPGGAGIGMHVIPVERAIEHENQAVDVERISHWLKKYDRFAAGACSCRVAERVRGGNAGSDPQNWCIAVGDMADYCVETGKGHFITYDEVLDILLLAEKNGYVHQITNIDGSDKIFAVCNCDVDVCYALRTSQLFNTPNMSRSAYIAEVDGEKCVACAGCVEVCPAGAVQLGQKIPTTNGAIEYPRQPLPTLSWGEDDWDADYKNNNRIECHETGTAPCKTACPAHISIQGYLRLASEGRYRDALELIKKENPFPAVCGRVCNKRCEAACTRATIDDPLAIDDVKRFIAEKDLEAEHRFVPEVVPPTTRGGFSEKIAIIGSGPAGLTCAYYLALAGYKPTVFEKLDRPGGMMTYGIPSYKLPKDVIDAEIDILRQLGVDIRCGVDVGRDVMLDDLRDQGYKAFYLAIGAQGARSLGLPGEDAKGVYSAVDFLRETMSAIKGEGSGIDGVGDGARDSVGGGAAAEADADSARLANIPHLQGKTIVIGGGNVAIDAARTALRCGSDHVEMYCLETRDEMPATAQEIEEALEENVVINNGWGPQSIQADEDGRVRSITLHRCTSVFNEDGAFAPTYDDSDARTVECTNVIMAIGQSIEWGGLLDGSAVELGRGGCALADPVTYQTAQEDVFVGGDAFTGPSFVIDAIAAGHEATVSLHRFAQTGSSLTVGRNQRHYVEMNKDDLAIDPASYDHAGRQKPTCPAVSAAICKDAESDAKAEKAPADMGDSITELYLDWIDRSATFTEDQIKAETARCLSCGASIVDPNKCIGCGLCTTRCEFDAIHLRREHPECSTMVKSEDKLKKILPNAGKMLIKKIIPGKKG